MALPVKIINQKGSSLLESLMIINCLSVFLFFIFIGGYTGLSKFWIRHELQQALLCLAKENSKYICTQKINKGLKVLITPGTLRPNLEVQSMKISGSVIWQINFGELSIWKYLSGRNNITIKESQSLYKNRLIAPQSRMKRVWL